MLCCRSQGFPDHYRFHGSALEKHRQVISWQQNSCHGWRLTEILLSLLMINIWNLSTKFTDFCHYKLGIYRYINYGPTEFKPISITKLMVSATAVLRFADWWQYVILLLFCKCPVSRLVHTFSLIMVIKFIHISNEHIIIKYRSKND